MSSDVTHPAGVGFHWKTAVGMSQRLRGGVGAGSEMLSPHNSEDAQDGGWMRHAVTPHRQLRHNPLSQRHGTPTCIFCAYILNFGKADFCYGKPRQSTSKYIFAE